MPSALVPFECPKCHRQYRMELDFDKLRRLNRVAICGKCRGRYSISVRMGRASQPFEPDPFAAERLLRSSRAQKPRGIRDERHKTWPDTPAHVLVGESVPPSDDPSVPPAERPLRPSDPAMRNRTLDGQGPDSAPPGDEGVPVHVIVQVGALDGEEDVRPTTKAYRASHLLTLPGIGLPSEPPPDD
jgi:hypothetical protein